ncbi:hypothetical protein BD626DRAFT_181071 [Schizophyllum amplum]|uniref:Uncharacterized protein n=1 Tax=Schizophyllum amplum TaxID=97359 RepID=A0A550C1C0_9AGAR|nr:hypothetical protein BD626DRAFT_181071 [Auriculariopsis ampla]
MSLCYIADDDAAERDAYLQALKDEGMMRQEGDGASLQCGEGKEDWVSGSMWTRSGLPSAMVPWTDGKSWTGCLLRESKSSRRHGCH